MKRSIEKKKFQKKPHLTKRVLEKKVYTPKRKVFTGINQENHCKTKNSLRRNTLPHKILRLAMSLFSH